MAFSMSPNYALFVRLFCTFTLPKTGDLYQDKSMSVFASDYALSSIRNWLNSTFLETAFSSSQIEQIKKTQLNNECSKHWGDIYDSAQTVDRVFLLSLSDVKNRSYGFNSDGDYDDSNRISTCTEYAKCQGIDQWNNVALNWILRTPNASGDVCAVSRLGDIYEGYGGVWVNSADSGIRPACCLKALKNDTNMDNNVTVSSPTDLKVTATNTTALNLAWNKVSGATGYVVYQYNASTKKYTKLGATKKTSYKVTNLKAGTTYQFAVKAYKTVDGKNHYSEYSSILKAMTVDPTPYKFKYSNVLYQSAAYDDFEDNSGWQTVEETVIKSGKFDWAKAVVGAVSANGDGDALGDYYNIKKGSAIDNMDLAGSVISMAHGFICGGREGINDVTMKLQTNGKENRMLLMYGQPIETAYGGQTLYYSEILINAHGGDAAYFLSAGKDADKSIRSIFSGLEPDGRYDLKIKFSKMKDWEDSPYKYTIVIGNDGKVIQYPIFHNGTKVELCYYAPKGEKGYSIDITRLLNSETIEVEKQVGKDIIDFLNSGSWKKNPKSQKITTGYNHYSKTLGSSAFGLNAKAKTTLSFTSNNKKVATVNSNGKVTIVGVGTAKIRIIATGTNKYNSATKYVTVTVKPKTPTISKISRTAADQVVVKWKTVEGASGYKVQYALNKDMSGSKTVRIANGARSSYTIKSIPNKKYYVRIAAYQTVDKTNYVSSWSKTKTIKAK